MPTTFKFRGYQNEGLRQLLSFITQGKKRLGVYYCTGAGKTALVLGLLTRCILHRPADYKGPKITHGIILTPFKSIRDQFSISEDLVQDDIGEPYLSPIDEDSNDKKSQEIPREITSRLRVRTAKDKHGFRDLQSYLNDVHENRGHVVHKATHDMGQNLLKWLEKDKHDLKGCLLVIDEAHHVRSDDSSRGKKTQLWDLVQYWEASGGVVVLLTATPDKVDQVVFRDDLPRVERTYVEQMVDRFAPKELISRLIHVEGKASEDDENAAIPEDTNQSIRRMIQDMVDDRDRFQSPIKAFVRAQSSTAEKNLNLILTMAEELELHGFRVFIGVPTYYATQEVININIKVSRAISGIASDRCLDLQQVLNHEEKIKDFMDSHVDVIIGMGAIGEGINWTVCSHVYLHGVPRRLETLIQMMGRGVRSRYERTPTKKGVEVQPKLANHPVYWTNNTKLVLLAAGNLKDVQSSHRSAVVMACAYLATFRSWSVYEIMTRSFEAVPHPVDEQRLEFVNRVLKERLHVAPEKKASIRMFMDDINTRLEDVGINPKDLSGAASAQLVMSYLYRGLLPTNKRNWRKSNIEDGGEERCIQWVEVVENDLPIRYRKDEALKVLMMSSPGEGRKVEEVVRKALSGDLPPEQFPEAISTLIQQAERRRRSPDSTMMSVRDYVLTAETIQNIASVIVPEEPTPKNSQASQVLARLS